MLPFLHKRLSWVVDMKRVLFILPNLTGGGAEKATLTLIQKLSRKDFQPILFLIRNEGDYWDLVPEDTKVITVLKSNQKTVFHLLKIFRKLFEVARGVDLMVGSLELTSTYLAAIVGFFFDIPSIGWVHTNIAASSKSQNVFHKILLRNIYPKLKFVIAVSEGVAKSLCELLPRLKSRVKVVHNPIPLREISILSAERMNINMKYDAPLVLAVGRLVPEKAFNILIQAHAKLIKGGVNHKLLILGEGPERRNLESLIKENRVEDSVNLLGFQKNPYPFLANADIFVLPSMLEGFGIVLVEAMHLGTPVIATNSSDGPLEVLEHGKHGLMIESGNVDDLVSAIQRLLSDKLYASELSKRGIIRAGDFNVDEIVPVFEKIFLESITT